MRKLKEIVLPYGDFISKAIFLDTQTLGNISLDPLKELPLDWTFYPNTLKEEVLERIQGAEIVVTNKVRLTKEHLKQSKIKLICVAATGVDNIDMNAAKDLGIMVLNIPDYSSSSVCQHTLLLIISLFGNLVPYANDVKNGEWQKSPLFTFLKYPLHEIEGKTLGIIGFGKIGQKVAHIASSFGMKILVASHPNRTLPNSFPINELLPRVDVLSIHLPLTAKTNNLITAKELKQMQRSSFLVNVSRGGIVNENDLADALKNGIIAGAALDVLTEEPPSATNPLLQKDVPNLILTPHIAWATLEARKRLMEVLKDNILTFLKTSIPH